MNHQELHKTDDVNAPADLNEQELDTVTGGAKPATSDSVKNCWCRD